MDSREISKKDSKKGNLKEVRAVSMVIGIIVVLETVLEERGLEAHI